MRPFRPARSLVLAAILLAPAVVVAGDQRAAADAACGGESCAASFRGLFAFLDRRPHGLQGNGRACADCHEPGDHFQLSPASAEARFRRLERRRNYDPRADDPLFRVIDADDFDALGAAASDYSNLRQNGLIRISFALPANIRRVDPATNLATAATSVDVWRMVPSIENVKLTGPDGGIAWPRGPNPTGGYQLDGRITTLQQQALAAFMTHAEVQVAPSPRLLDDLSAFQRVVYSNPRVRALAAAVDAGALPLPSADPPLNELAQQGKAVFERACTQCHGGPGLSTPKAPVVRYHDISTQCPRPVDTAVPARWSFKPCPARLARNAQTYEIALPTGATIRRVSSDPGRALLTGFVGGPPAADDWNKLDVSGLHGISRTAPYFHNNSADTLEDVVDHYIEFFKRVRAIAPPGVVPPIASTDGVNFDRAPTVAERAALVEYLKTL